MRYLEFNILRQNKHFVSIREAGGASMTNDIYVRNPESDTFWFGKVAFASKRLTLVFGFKFFCSMF